MRSQLTRSVFRRILANQPFTHSYCHRRPRQWAQQAGVGPQWALQRRSFFGLFAKQEEDEYFTTEYKRHFEPGMQVMEDLSDAVQQRSRPPDIKKLAAAFSAFFQARSRARSQGDQTSPLTEYHTRHLVTTFNWLQEQKNNGGGVEIADEDLVLALNVLGWGRFPEELYPDIVTLSTKIFQALRAPAVKESGSTAEGEARHQPLPAELYILILSTSGKSDSALSMLQRWSKTNAPGLRISPSYLQNIIRGFAREGKEAEAIQSLETFMSMEIPRKREEFQDILYFFTSMNYGNLSKQALKIHNRFWPKLSGQSLRNLLALSIRTNELDWGKQFFQNLTAQDEISEETWGLVLLWVVANGHGPEEIEKVVAGILSKKKSKSQSGPSISSINQLMTYANSKNNPYAAERYLAMGLRWGLTLDAETSLLQMESRVQAGDIDGATACYRQLEEQEQVSENRDLPALNKFLRALCSARNVDYSLIFTVLDKLLGRKTSLHPETVAALCELFIQRGELGEATDLLKRARLDLYSRSQREKISKAMFRLVVERQGKVMQTWQAYELLIKAFPEISVQDRTTIMNSFFARNQSDMACMVFGHMRQSQDSKKRPTADTYVECFQGLANSPDEDSLQLVHNMLKLDTHVELNTKLYNGLMLAYMNSESPQRSLEYWDDILNSQEGPTYSSIVIVLAACERALGGNKVARIIMQRLESLEIEISSEIYAAYLGALSGHGEYQEALTLVERMRADIGVSPDVLTVASIYNANPFEDGRAEIEEWTKERYPEIWDALVKAGYGEPDMIGRRDFKVDRIPKA